MVRTFNVITLNQGAGVAGTRTTTGNWYTCTVTSSGMPGKRTALLMSNCNCDASGLLEPCARQLASTVLRGRRGSATFQVWGFSAGFGVRATLNGEAVPAKAPAATGQGATAHV